MKLVITTIMILGCIPLSGNSLPDSVMFKILHIEKQIMNASDHEKAELLLQKAGIYKEHLDFDNAIHSLDRIPSAEVTPGITKEKAFVSFFGGQYSNTLHLLWELPDLENQSKDVRMLYLMALLENEYWEEFRTTLKQEYINKGMDTTQLLATFKSPQLNYTPKISIIPSAALFKNSHIKKAALNLSLQAAFLSFGIYHLANGFYFIGTFSGILPTRRFYSGGRRLAKSLALDSNDTKTKELRTKGYQLISPLLN